MAETSEPIYTKEQAGILTAVAALQTELRMSREQQAKDNELFREQASKDNIAIIGRLDKLGELVGKHSEWIAGKVPICQVHCDRLAALETQANETKDTLETQAALIEEIRGVWKGVRLIAVAAALVGSAFTGAVAFIYHITHMLPTPKVP